MSLNEFERAIIAEKFKLSFMTKSLKFFEENDGLGEALGVVDVLEDILKNIENILEDISQRA